MALNKVTTGFGAIPASVVSRTQDNATNNSLTSKSGVRIESTVEWPSIGARLSTNTGAGATTAYIHRVSDGVLMGSTDISALSGGDAFTVDDVDLSPNTAYNFVIDNGGSSYVGGYYSSPSYPYDSPDGQLSIINSGFNDTGTNPNGVFSIVDVGDVGF
jgi:hypothetical protein